MSRPTPDQLRATPYFLGCTLTELSELAGLTDLVTLGPDAVLAERGGPPSDVHLVLAGEAGSDPPGQRWGPGDFVGELAVLQRASQQATVVTRTPTTLLSAHGRDAAPFLAHPAVALHLSWVLGQRLRPI